MRIHQTFNGDMTHNFRGATRYARLLSPMTPHRSERLRREICIAMSLANACEITRKPIDYWPTVPSLSRILLEPWEWISDMRCRMIINAAHVLAEDDIALTHVSISDQLKGEYFRVDRFLKLNSIEALPLPLADIEAELLIIDHGRALLAPEVEEESETV